ncbi:MAG: O-Antigen ligase, partial [Verrucomicrobiota bacterium]
MVAGKGTGLALHWCKRAKPQSNLDIWLLFLVGSLLLVGVYWHRETPTQYLYHGVLRWSGVFENPNLLGLSAAVGLVLAVGLGVGKVADGSWQLVVGSWKNILLLLFCIAAAILCSVGLFKSYSRGAWLAAAVGVGYFLWNAGARSQEPEVRSQKPEGSASSIVYRLSSRFFAWLRKNRWSFAVIFASCVVIAFWQLRFTEFRPAQRLVSVGNANDFSWRNRVAAWQGAVQLMADRPWGGWGWGQVENAYQKNYLPARIDSPAAIQMNDYLMLGAAAGIPALFFFVGYLVVSSRGQGPAFAAAASGNSSPALFFATRGAAIVLLVGFWFDGGLFKLPTGVTFWFLWETSRFLQETTYIPPVDLAAGRVALPNRSRVMGWVAVIVATAALFLTALHLITPRLPVSERTLAVARTWLVSQQQMADFSVLAADSAWRGRRLRDLLTHVELAGYNRGLVNWTVDEQVYREFVLSPNIAPACDGQLDWRRELWEHFYPLIRREMDMEPAARLVLDKLHGSMKVSAAIASGSISEAWQRG